MAISVSICTILNFRLMNIYLLRYCYLVLRRVSQRASSGTCSLLFSTNSTAFNMMHMIFDCHQ